MTAPEKQMPAIELARMLAELGDTERALIMYDIAMKDADSQPVDRLEAACAVLQYGNNYKSAYDAFLALFRDEKEVRGDVLSILTEAFYGPNVKKQEKQYKKNCKILKSYPYIFRKDFLPFEELPVLFYPYDDDGVLPFHKDEERFDAYIDVNYPEVTHYFFRDLEKPIFARDIFSQYELEYLRDNVRRSDWAAKENHVYLHYSNWGEFCSYLALLDMKPLLEHEKFVFLLEEEESLYPIDFKERFGIDYSQFSVKPFSVTEFHKMIWHTQLGYHNGGDFFNEIIHDHPYILFDESRFLDQQTELIEKLRDTIRETAESNRGQEIRIGDDVYNPAVLHELLTMKKVTLKDAFVGFYLSRPEHYDCLDKNSRIVPALFYQPHFANQKINWAPGNEDGAVFEISGWDEVNHSPIFQAFKYIKTFTPMRRPTTSLGGTVRFVERDIIAIENGEHEDKEGTATISVMGDLLLDFMMNRSFMVDNHDRMFCDSCLVRFEDGKLNPVATFTALAEFLDVPYTESMTYCSDVSGRDIGDGDLKAIGFDTSTVYRKYEKYVDENERKLLEYALRDAYERYGYDFEQYDGKPMSKDELEDLLKKAVTVSSYIEKGWRAARKSLGYEGNESVDRWVDSVANERKDSCEEQRRLVLSLLGKNVKFYSKQGKPLQYMKKIEPVPALLVQPLYR